MFPKKDGDRFWKMSECYIRGSTIKYMRIPDEVVENYKEDNQNRGGNSGRRDGYQNNRSGGGRGGGQGGRGGGQQNRGGGGGGGGAGNYNNGNANRGGFNNQNRRPNQGSNQNLSGAGGGGGGGGARPAKQPRK